MYGSVIAISTLNLRAKNTMGGERKPILVPKVVGILLTSIWIDTSGQPTLVVSLAKVRSVLLEGSKRYFEGFCFIEK